MQISKFHKSYPSSFLKLKKVPSSLYYKGKLELLRQPRVSIVGARDMTASTQEWMENEIGPLLEDFAMVVVSGGARGVDQFAHSMAMRKSQGTIVIVPSGLSQIYPKSIEGWVQNDNVLFVSEYPNNIEMRKHHFYDRNRLIVALSSLLIVVQAKEKSGTMMTARLAMESGKDVAVVPGFPLDSHYGGSNQLIYDGAHMIRNKQDLMALLSQSLYINSNSCAVE